MRLQWVVGMALAAGTLAAQSTRVAISSDPPPDLRPAASITEIAVPSHGAELFGVFYEAAGAENHPTVVLLHGFPGYEQNLDLAQALRRAGWNVLALHYRGSWGVGGNFSLAHSIEDSDAMVEFVLSPATAKQYRIDRSRIVVIGHSMGAYMAASATAHNPAVLATVMIGTWDITDSVRGKVGLSRDEMVERVENRGGTESSDYLPLHGTSPQMLAAEIVDHREAWDLDGLAAKIAPRPVLLLTADDGSTPGSIRLEQALETAGDTRVERMHAATDHSWSGRRIELETIVLNWLGQFEGKREQ